MKNYMNWIRLIGFNIAFGIVLFFLTDFFITRYIFDRSFEEKKYRISHPIYHHTFKSDFKGIGYFGDYSYPMCTDSWGFKSSCNGAGESYVSADIAFIGDSFVEGVGLKFDDTFVGRFAEANPTYRIVNMGVASYSPSVYFKKVENLLRNGFRFGHLVVFIDISDVHDEAARYIENVDGTLSTKDNNEIPLFENLKTFVKYNFYLFSNLYMTVHDALASMAPGDNEEVFDPLRSRWTIDEGTDGYGILGVKGGISKSLLYMTKLHTMLDAHDIKLSVGLYPWPAQLREMGRDNYNNTHSDIWNEFCLKRCSLFIDINNDFNELVKSYGYRKVYQDYYLSGDVHFNEKGNGLIYNAIERSISLSDDSDFFEGKPIPQIDL